MSDTCCRRVVCAAILFENGDILVGARHFDATMHYVAERHGIDRSQHHVQGFIDQHGVFMDRKEAFQVASEAGQIINPRGTHSGELYSECLY